MTAYTATCTLRRLALSALLVVGLQSAAAAQDVVAVDAANPPFMYEAGGKAAGVYPALIDEAFKRVGAPVAIQALPWKRALRLIDDGEAAVGGIYKNDERLKKYDYTDLLFNETIQVFVPKGKAFPFTGPDSLKGKSVGVLFGWSYGDVFDKARADGSIKVQEVASDQQNFVKLAAGRVDAVLAIKESANVALAGSDLNDKIEALPEPFAVSAAYIAFAKTAKKGDLIAKLNAALADMAKDGSKDKIVSSALAH